MAKKKITQTTKKVKKKRWYRIVAPKLFQNAELGETNVIEPEAAYGKPVKVSLMNLTNDIKKQNIHINFKVAELQGSNLVSEVVGYEMIPSAIKRLVRRRRDRLDESFMCRTADKKLIRIKLFLLTRSRTISSVLHDIRKKMVESTVRDVSKLDYENFVGQLINHKFQNQIRSEINKIYPVKNFEVRYFKVTKDDSGGRLVEAESKPAPAKEKPADDSKKKAPEKAKSANQENKEKQDSPEQ